MSEPKSINSGTKVIWSRNLVGSESAQYDYVLVSEQRTHMITAVYVSGELVVDVPTAKSESLVSGHYHWFLIETLSGEKKQIDEGRIEIKANPLTLNTTVVLTHNEKMLTAIRKRLEGRVLTDHENYSIDGRSLSRIPFDVLKKLENAYAWRVHKEQVARNERPRRGAIRYR